MTNPRSRLEVRLSRLIRTTALVSAPAAPRTAKLDFVYLCDADRARLASLRL